MSVTSTASVHASSANAPSRATSPPPAAKLDAGVFTRSTDGAKAQQIDERRISPRVGGIAMHAGALNHGDRVSMNRELKFIESVYRQRIQPGQPLNFSLHGKPATLSVGAGHDLILRSKVSANPNEPSGVIRFKNGKIDFASLDSGAPMTARQQANMVSGVYQKIALGLLNKH